jgi:hypothetical protein
MYRKEREREEMGTPKKKIHHHTKPPYKWHP